MLSGIVDWSLDNRAIVLLLTVLLAVGGSYSLTQLPIDAVPDVTNVQVQISTKAPALGPVEIELFGARCRVISLEDLIRAKEALGREKDRLAVKELRAIAEKRQRE